MTSFFLKKQNNNALKEIVKFESKLDQKLLNQKDSISNKLKQNLFIKENVTIFIYHDYLFENAKKQCEKYLNLAISILDDCKEYS